MLGPFMIRRSVALGPLPAAVLPEAKDALVETGYRFVEEAPGVVVATRWPVPVRDPFRGPVPYLARRILVEVDGGELRVVATMMSLAEIAIAVVAMAWIALILRGHLLVLALTLMAAMASWGIVRLA